MDVSHSVEQFFREEMNRALQQQKVATGAFTEQYLVKLLASYATQRIDEEPLALKMLSAVHDPPQQRRRRLREVGDTSLFVSGFWADSLGKRLVDVDYYIEMGGTAYGELARSNGRSSWDPLGEVFGELSGKFERFVEVFGQVSRRTALGGSSRDVVRLYDRWRRTKSRWVERRLAALGMVMTKGAAPQ